MKIRVAQHVFGNVEQAESPTGVGGFQTLFYTHDMLNPEEVEELEAKVIYYQSGQNPIKYLYFQLDSGKVSITRIQPMTEARDRFGREGSYLGHSILVSEDDFRQVGNDPFIIFDRLEESNTFFTDTSRAMSRGDRVTGNIKAVELTIPEQKDKGTVEVLFDGLAQWSVPELQKLALHALNYREVIAKRQPLVMVGEPKQMMSALRIAIYFLLPQFRTEISFDTHFHGCNLVRNHYWVIGFPAPSDSLSSLVIANLKQRKIQGRLPAPKDHYQQWVIDRIAKQEFETIKHHGSLIYQLDKLVSRQPYENAVVEEALVKLSDKRFDELTLIFKAELIKEVEKQLENSLGPKLNTRLNRSKGKNVYPLQEVDNGNMKQLIRIYIEGLDKQRLAQQFHDQVKELMGTKPNKKEFRELKQFSKETGYQPLAQILSKWQEKVSERKKEKIRRFLNKIPFIKIKA